jgi:hypothetical protein
MSSSSPFNAVTTTYVSGTTRVSPGRTQGSASWRETRSTRAPPAVSVKTFALGLVQGIELEIGDLFPGGDARIPDVHALIVSKPKGGTQVVTS